MKNMHLTELLESRDIPLFSSEASLASLVQSIREGRQVRHFYLTAPGNHLVGIIPWRTLMEYLLPGISLIDRTLMPALAASLNEVRAMDLVDESVPWLTLKNTLPEAMTTILLSGYTALPVLDSRGRFAGELALENILEVIPIENRKEAFHAVP